MKKLLSILLCCVFLLAVPMTALAENDQLEVVQINPRFTYIVDAEAGLEINNETATVDCWVKGHYDTATKAKIIVELQLESGANNWIAHATWVNTQNDFEASVYETKSVKTGQNYRVKVTATVWEGSQSETVTFFTDEMTA